MLARTLPSRRSLLLLGLLAMTPALRAPAQNSDPATLLSQAKKAAGGSAWDKVRTLHWHEKTVSGGLTGTQDEWDDVRTGRFATPYSFPPSSGSNGFDGVSFWTQGRDGYSYILGDEDAREGAINQAYETCRAYWFPERAHATLALAPQENEGGRAYDVIEITPQAGRPFTVWLDHETHLIDRFVEQQGEDMQIVRLLDYRTEPGGLNLPHTIRTGDGDTKWDDVDTVESVQVNAPLASGQFALPPIPPAAYQFPSGQTSVTVPFRLSGNKLLLPVMLNGQGPFDAELDSGGNYLIQPALAQRLHLQGEGASQEGGGGEGFVAASRTILDTVGLGSLRLTHQAYKILAFSGDDPNRTLLGLQVLQRFVVSIDFDRGTVTFTQPNHFTYHGQGTIVPFHFQDNQPEVLGSVDGIAGEFAIDTGDSGSLLLIAPFAQRYDLAEQYGATIPYGGSAVGGATHGLMTRAKTFALCGADGRPTLEVHEPLTRISTQKGGFDADRYVSGNVGIGILEQFNLIFDYTRQRIIFEKNKNYGARDVFNRTGLALKMQGAEWDVISVVPGSPAADAGIKTGDRISAINGHPPAQLDREAQYALFRQKVGTKLTLSMGLGSGNRSVTLQLREIL